MPGPDDPLEELLAEAIACGERGGADVLERFLAAHPAAAPRLREALQDLRLLDRLSAAGPALPQHLGEFRLLGRLGEGGMGVVHLAEQSSLGREVALKVVRPELLLFDGARERFRREIDAVARLEHPAIVPILATGSADGVPWYAMPRLRGLSGEAVVAAFTGRTPRELTGADLVRLLAGADETATDHGTGDGALQGPWWQVMVRLVRQAALGIAHAHTRGVLHRDLKPSNVMLTSDGRAIVLDFGLAQARGDERLTRTGAAAGSPAYMAPEQLRGEGADERTDVYGLGATLHCLLGLRPPFPLGDGEQLRSRIAAGDRQPLRDRSGAPPELLLVVDTAMDVERARRHAGALAFADDLQAVLDGRPITARRLPLRVRARRFVQRHRALSAAAAVAAVFVVMLPTVLLWQQRRANDDLAAAVARTDAANRALGAEVERANRSTDVAIDTIERLLGRMALPRLRNLPAVQSVAADLLDDATALFDRLADDPVRGVRVQDLRRRTLYEAGVLRADLGQKAAARERLDRVLRVLGERDVPPGDRVLRLKTRMRLAWISYREGRLDDVPPLLAAARRDAAAAPPGRHELDAAREMASVAELECGLASDRGDHEGTLRAARERVAILERWPRGDGVDLLLLDARMALGAHLRDAGDTTASRPLLEGVVAALASVDLPEVGWPVPRLVLAMARLELGSLDRDERRWDPCMQNLRAAGAVFDELVRDYPDDPAVRRCRGRGAGLLASVLNDDEQWQAARALAEQAIDDQQFARQRNPDDRRAAVLLAMHHRVLLVSLRALQDWPALERTARALGQLAGGLENSARAARDLLRCIPHAAEDRRPALCVEALDLLERAVADGLRLQAQDPVYAPVRGHERFAALVAKASR